LAVGIRISVTISPSASAVVRAPMKNSVAGIVRAPLALRTPILASHAASTAGISEAGSA